MTEQTGAPWSEREVRATIRTYLEMWDAERSGTAYVKAEFRRQLKAELPARSDAAIERKFCNVSAAMVERGLLPVKGYRPLPHKQGLVDLLLGDELASRAS